MGSYRIHRTHRHRALLEEADDNVVLTADKTFTFRGVGQKQPRLDLKVHSLFADLTALPRRQLRDFLVQLRIFDLKLSEPPGLARRGSGKQIRDPSADWRAEPGTGVGAN